MFYAICFWWCCFLLLIFFVFWSVEKGGVRMNSCVNDLRGNGILEFSSLNIPLQYPSVTENRKKYHQFFGARPPYWWYSLWSTVISILLTEPCPVLSYPVCLSLCLLVSKRYERYHWWYLFHLYAGYVTTRDSHYYCCCLSNFEISKYLIFY